MRVRALMLAAIVAVFALAATRETNALGRPGVTPVPCPAQEWQPGDPKFEALPGARAFFGSYDGGLYRIEIPDNWNGELALYAHGFVSNGGAQGSALRVGNSPIREHLIKNGYAWAASSYRCNGYVPGQGLLDTMALTDRFTKFNDARPPQRVYLTGTSMGGHVTLLGKSPEYTEKGRQLASVEIQISGGPRPFAMEGLAAGGRFAGNINPAALAGSTTPSNRAVMTTHIKYGSTKGLA